MSNLRYTLAAIRKDIGRFLKDPVGLLLLICMPAMVGILVNLAFGGSDDTPTARLMIADEDDSLLSGLLTGAFGQGEMAELINTESVTRAEGEREVYKGRASALLVVPEGFGDSFLNGEPDTLSLLTNPAQTILPGIIRETLEIMTTGGGLLREFLGPQIDLINSESGSVSDSFSDQMISSMAVDINLMEGASTWLFPPAIKFENISVDTTASTDAEASMVTDEEKTLLWYFFPSLLTLLLIFAGMTLSSDIWKERQAGTIRRGLSVPFPVRWLILGKFLAGALVVLTVLLLATFFGRFVLRLPHQSWLAGALFLALFGAALISGMTALQVLFRTERGASIVVMFFVMVMMFGGGSFFPLEALPDFMQKVAMYLPNGWALIHYKAVIEGNSAPGDLLVPVIILISIFILSWSFCSWQIARRWGSGSA
ncbi:ABC transporter permease [Gemmatimonadota bacterium]